MVLRSIDSFSRSCAQPSKRVWTRRLQRLFQSSEIRRVCLGILLVLLYATTYSTARSQGALVRVHDVDELESWSRKTFPFALLPMYDAEDLAQELKIHVRPPAEARLGVVLAGLFLPLIQVEELLIPHIVSELGAEHARVLENNPGVLRQLWQRSGAVGEEPWSQ